MTPEEIAAEPADPAPEQTSEQALIEGLRAEFSAQLDDLRVQTAEVIKAKDSQIAQLEGQVRTLQTAAVANFVSSPAPAPKSEADLYRERIDALAKKTLSMMR